MASKRKRYLLYISLNYSYAILRPLQDFIKSRGDEVCWFLAGNKVNPNFLKDSETRLMTIDEVNSWQPDAVFVPGNFVPSFIPGIKVGVFHGFSAGKQKRKGQEDHFKIRECFDLYCTQGPDTTVPFQQLAKQYGNFQVVETGWSAMDPLFNTQSTSPYYDENDDRPVVLFCSTFSPRYSCAAIIYEQIKLLSKTDKYRWLVQFHPKMDREVVDKYKALQNDNLSFIETDNILPLLKAADVMLCDTSSVLIMFLLQGKPVVTFNNKTNSPHLINIDQLNEIEPALDRALAQPESVMEAISNYCKNVHPDCDGNSSQRVLAATDKLIESGLAGMRPKAMNLWRNLKIRKKLGYWKW
ncbi:CDP-glycerol glycerophosphotransferase family protein [Shewanella sp. UCD-KL21]|uniref:CDP-glycerol glycerophosphotransferase family protein n=1 Tax=Shewanella sp. UCD-KL21 TaxID=1917164 RepID=UPI00097129CF|nr:CDP-glycerol glycerophosphotransferase family protein [Shewanella sp. UCD-KL21]